MHKSSNTAHTFAVIVLHYHTGALMTQLYTVHVYAHTIEDPFNFQPYATWLGTLPV